jgi:hypothetical protein
VDPSTEYPIVFPPDPTATHRVPFHVTPFPAVVKQLDAAAVHAIPSVEYKMVFPPVPAATQRDPFHAIPFPEEVNNEKTSTR